MAGNTAESPGRGVPAPYFTDFVGGRRGEILDAALSVFGEKGYEAGTMREIAARVGVSEPAIYRHYESKEAILAEIVALAGDRIAGEIAGLIGEIRPETVREQLFALIERRRAITGEGSAAGTLGVGSVLPILLHAAPHNDRFVALLRTHVALPLSLAVRAAIPRIDEGFGITRPVAEVDGCVRVFMSVFVGYFSTSILFDAPPNDEAIVNALLGMMGWVR
jgi:AcrR family transcriptional regulator